MSPHDQGEEPPLLSREDYIVLLSTYSINAYKSHKLINKNIYKTEINVLAQVCANLLTHYHETPQEIIAHMEKILTENHNKELQEIDCHIKHLFNIRKQAPAETFYGEQEIIKLTTQITELQRCRAMPCIETIKRIVNESLIQAMEIYGAELPAGFNLNQYEDKPLQPE